MPSLMREEDAMSKQMGGTVEGGQVISLTQRSARRREYDMRAGECALGWLRWQPGRRSFAQAEAPPEPASTGTPVRTNLAQVG